VKNLLRVVLAVMLLSACLSTTALADGTSPPADCDPFSTPHCPPPVPPAHPPLR
jgi:hypothetical protein